MSAESCYTAANLEWANQMKALERHLCFVGKTDGF